MGHLFGSFFSTLYIQTRYEDVDSFCLCDTIARCVSRILHVEALKPIDLAARVNFDELDT
jgi:hypothetical protein